MFGYLLEPCIEIWNFFLNLVELWLLKNHKKAHDFSTLYFYIVFIIILYSQKRRLIETNDYMWQRVWDPCNRALVGFRALAGGQAGAAGVCLSVLPCECTINARDCCDEAAVLQFSLRSFLLPICGLWESVASPPCTDKKRFGRIFFLAFCQCGGFASNRGAGSIECMFFFPFLPPPFLFTLAWT
jgi:hypothetical protein